MKKIFLLICSCVFCFAFGHASSYTPSYYYSLGKKCELSRIESKLAFQKLAHFAKKQYLCTAKDHGLTDFSVDGTTVWRRIK